MVRKYLTRLIFLFAALSTLAPAVQAAGQPQTLDRIVAVVNKDVILKSELDAQLQQIKSRLVDQGVRMPPDNVLEQQVLQRLVMQKLQLQMADRVGLQVSDDMLNQALSGIAAKNGFTLAEFPARLKQEGQNYAQYREQIRDQMTVDYLQHLVVYRRIDVSDQEIDQYLATQDADNGTQYHVRQILVALPADPTPHDIDVKRKRAEQVLGLAKGDAGFAQTAVAYSDGQQALDGGDLGWRTRAQLPTLFTDVIDHLKPGQISDIIRSPSGFHIVKLEGLRRDNEHKVIVTQTHARHILIKPNTLVSDTDAQQKLAKLRQEIKAGGDFGKLAKQESDDRRSAADGGDLGWTSPGDLDKHFQQVMDDLKPGEISEPFKTQFGWHIVQVLDRRNKDMTDEKRREKAAEAIRQRKFEEQLPIWMQQLWDKAYLEFYLGDSGDMQPDAAPDRPNAG